MKNRSNRTEGDDIIVNTRITISAEHAGEDKNATHIVMQALETVKCKKNSEIFFEKGEYHFRIQGTFKQFYAVSNNESGDKNIVFPIIDFDGLTIDGNGSVFVFHDVVFPFVVDRSQNIVIKNLILDLPISPNVALRVCERSEKGFKLEVDKTKNPFYVKDGCAVFQTENGEVSTSERKMSLHMVRQIAVQYLFAGDSSDSTENLPASHMLTDAIEVEGGIYFTYRDDTPSKCRFDEGEILTCTLGCGRKVDVVFLQNSEEILIKQMIVRRGIGMGVIGQLCKNIEIDGFCTDVTFHDEPVTLTADALHFVNCRGFLEVHNCDISHTMDDAINVHGIYTVVKQVDADKLVLSLKHQEQFFFNPYKEGDKLTIISPENLEVVAKFTVANSRVMDETGMDLEVHGTFCFGYEHVKNGFYVENPENMPNIHLHDNHFYYFPHMRLAGGGDILVENNRLEHARSALLAFDLVDYWYESGRIEHMVFRNNYMNGCNEMGGHSFIQIGLPGRKKEEAPKVHNYIEISNNVFENISKKAVIASGVQNLILKNNIFDSKVQNLIEISCKENTT